MNFNFKTVSMFLAGAALMLTGCKDDVLSDDGGKLSDYQGRVVHVTAGISLPTGGGTRSATDDSTETGNDLTNSNQTPTDYEYGYDYENEIRTMILLYTDENDKYITHSTVTGITKAPVTGEPYDLVITAEVKHDDLYKAYTEGVLKDYDGETPIHVYAFCNYTDNLATKFANADSSLGSDWLDWVGTINEGYSAPTSTPLIQNTIWANRSFLMTNARIANVSFPKDIKEWDNYADKSTPWELNSLVEGNEDQLEPIKVERSAARIDFRDGSKEGDQTYRLSVDPLSYGDQIDSDTDESGEMNLISIKLTRMALVNMSKNFYYLRRVSKDGTDTNWVYGGIEYSAQSTNPNATPYVVDTDWEAKTKRFADGYDNSGFNFPLYVTEPTDDGFYQYNKTAWYTDNIGKVLQGANDTWSGSTDNRYHIWRYVTENTIPAADDDPSTGEGANQITGQSTGIIFKGQILAGDDVDNEDFTQQASEEIQNAVHAYISADAIKALQDVGTNKQNSPILYSFENRLFAGPKDIIIAARNDGENSALYGAVSRVLANWKMADGTNKYIYNGDGTELDVSEAYTILINQEADDYTGPTIEGLTDVNFRPYCPAQKIAVYVASDENDGEGWGYYCYYFYWNRHNDNNKSGLMGPMEFATVRNNVYKLAVTSIGKLGHPTIPEDDPDPEDPNTPDEPPMNYMKVQVDVLPWVVRVNDITF